jgi:hypothetical protein
MLKSTTKKIKMVQAMFGLTQVMGMICSKGKLKTISNFITKKRTQD